MSLHEEIKKKINGKETGAFTCSIEGMRMIKCWEAAHKELSEKYEELKKGIIETTSVWNELTELQKRMEELRGQSEEKDRKILEIADKLSKKTESYAESRKPFWAIEDELRALVQKPAEKPKEGINHGND